MPDDSLALPLMTEFYVPPLRGTLVPRPSLLDKLDSGLHPEGRWKVTHKS
jgi:hypothetical protein